MAEIVYQNTKGYRVIKKENGLYYPQYKGWFKWKYFTRFIGDDFGWVGIGHSSFDKKKDAVKLIQNSIGW